MAVSSDPQVTRRKGLDPNPEISPGNRRALSGPACLSASLTLGPAQHGAHRVTGGQATQAWGAVLALVTSQCHMQIVRRQGLPARGNQ